MAVKQVCGRYTQEYKTEAIRQVPAGQSLSVMAQVPAIAARAPLPQGAAPTGSRSEFKGFHA